MAMRSDRVGQPSGRGDTFHAYTGAAPQPTRVIAIGDRTANGTTIAQDAGLFPVGPPDLSAPPQLPRGMRSSPPPEDSETAAVLAEMKQQIGQLTDSIGKMRHESQAKLEEVELNHQIQLLTMRGRQLPTLPEGINPQQNVTLGDMTQILSRFGSDFESAIMRRTWDITPEEELEVLNANPSLQQLTEPDRTGLIKRAVETRRRSRGAASPTNSSTSAPGSTAAPAPANSRPIAGHVVPMVETTSPGDVGELTPQNAYQQAINEYRDADKIPDRTRRLAAKKNAAKKAQFALGISDEQMATTAFSQRG